ncbi:PREDICTED: E3 ubiquitin protein ligase DRIP2 isoform X1 [Camelina sativa]|uniref:E3 ubiquitin protein ligase DRIP2 isoform X1 n=1 Tax=Camelina sativa TaxID=90675 RepID=A0ABM0Z4J7_CAMSA|nr:PREDICTED: E3 ubiquitin protein ligase DRIP2 isoform X1 [Camelina sativa]XP_010510331.1 PREDICTED: E3 ubiquitin protein ligase DRIP2 isoform X1 [Camelina sativa]XP_010510333.1 PREDICTED: E3 ubiquitin protein ligase DRIP2 isoform X1 [Camelina sativa]XP_010510334.1 PREDICTED: E3 ubiquitin protein ligase DRIP2 isoform X1 [Camelina sativa]XP_010510335.1 PREDICTED: E3 ubiquitin protein ligase DRIP2 isoform X1 [Camelina sativa]
MEGGNMVVRVKRDTVVACMTCSLCDNLLRDATTISECLHTFCRKCIYEKITEDEIECCPVCDIDLGGTPLEKLKPDHILQDLRTKLFPLKRKRESVSSNTLPARRKERSISSLVVSTPRVAAQAGTTGKRTKTATRKDVRGSGSFTKRVVKKEEEFGDDNTESASSPETLKKFTQNKRQVKKSSYAEPNQALSNRRNKSGDEPWDSKLHSWKPLNFLVEVANGTEDSKSEHGNASHNDVEGSKTKTKEQKRKCKLEEEISNNGDPTTSETATLKRTRRTRRKRSSSFGDSRISPLPGAASLKQERRNGPVWFSLVASTNQDGETSLPQIPANYLRLRDGSIPVSHIQKYLMKKLDLKSETEVEIKCMGEPVLPTLQLHSLVDLWLETTSKHERVAASVGSSAKEFVMVLVYGRKLPESNN